MPNRMDIPTGREHAITKAELMRLWHCTDREARAQIAHFRMMPSDDNFAILSSSRPPAGYWRSDMPHEIAEFIRESESRGRNVFRMLKDARRVLSGKAV